MRSTFLFLLLSLMAGGLLLMNARRPSDTSAPAKSSTSVTEHNWAKQALDRTADVKRQVAQQRKDDDVK